MLKAVTLLCKHLFGTLDNSRGKIPTYLGVTGGNHIFRAKDGRVFSVDLVIEEVTMCVGLLPEHWATPPKKH